MKFLSRLTRIVNTGQSRCIVLHGNVYDQFYDGKAWLPLVELLISKTKVEKTPKSKGVTQVVYQLNRPIEVIGDENFRELETAWNNFAKDDKKLNMRFAEAMDNSVYAFELMRQLSECVRHQKIHNDLLFIIEAADLLLPETPVGNMSMVDRKRIGVLTDWLCDPKFTFGNDTVILTAESLGSVHRRVSGLPQVLGVEIELPSEEERQKLIEWWAKNGGFAIEANSIAQNTSGLSLHAVLQLLKSGNFSAQNIVSKVEEYMIAQLGEGVVEFKRPTHKLADVVGFRRIKKFFTEEIIPGFKSDDPSSCVSGVLVGGPIGGGKTFICEAVASELGCPVITLKNIRSKWYGETDQIVEKLKRQIRAFRKVVVFIDEADTMFGGISSDQDVERRLTGSFQTMMSDPALRGRVVWFLMTARVHLLSPDIRRPGRMDVILPILDPLGDQDHKDFVNWTFGSVVKDESILASLTKMTYGMSAATYGLIRSIIKRKKPNEKDVYAIVQDIVEPDIRDARKYQALQAMLNCTRRSLLVDEGESKESFEMTRDDWAAQLKALEAKGIK
jgi:hypothetical protein